jgi:signal peptidase
VGRRGQRASRAAGAVGTAAVALCLLATAGAVFGFRLSIRPVLSASMRPTYGPGWIIVTRSIPVSSVRPGDIVVITPPGSDVQVAHRVVTVSGPRRDPVITTKGDANPGPDPWRAHFDGSEVPEVVGEVPGLGYVMVALEHSRARVVLIALLGLALAVEGARAILHEGTERSGAATAARTP